MSAIEIAAYCLGVVIIVAAFRWALKKEPAKRPAQPVQHDREASLVSDYFAGDSADQSRDQDSAQPSRDSFAASSRQGASTGDACSQPPARVTPSSRRRSASGGAARAVTPDEPLPTRVILKAPASSDSARLTDGELLRLACESSSVRVEGDVGFFDRRTETSAPVARAEPPIGSSPNRLSAAVAPPAATAIPSDDRRASWFGSSRLFQARPSSQPARFRWYGRGETTRVGSYTLTDPLVYCAPGPPREEEASCIDFSLALGESGENETLSLGYYPTYSRMTAQQRAAYLQWLANGRCQPLNDIGYAFLFFYGLERRLLFEQQDLSPIVKEVVRLLETYTFSGSFDGYLSRFLAYVLARAGIGGLKDKWFEAVFEKTRAQRDEQHLSVGLAWLHTRNLPLPASWALRIARLDPRAPGASSWTVCLRSFPRCSPGATASALATACL